MALSDLVSTAAFSLDQRNRSGAVDVICIGWAFGDVGVKLRLKKGDVFNTTTSKSLTCKMRIWVIDND
ncbi:MAG: hypothetical protein C4B59_16230 [Candidatus Methanogaster sp.]|uniref:Uncharacterized protein n=1 Tax=Candidatus Methanogaster sp. TaxID=3386292 RepID=A0AC61KY97_9EURY|nr:MAG: hypothetical protein C4B59_16230 [ANME-2 cluster archaeon]